MAIKEILEGNTSKITEATELLKVLGDREGQFVWKQLTAEGGDFVAFVTADSEDSYPNKGTQDGYWYELVEEGVNLSIEGYSMAVDKIIFSSNTILNTLSVNHSLGKVPVAALLIASVSPVQSTSATNPVLFNVVYETVQFSTKVYFASTIYYSHGFSYYSKVEASNITAPTADTIYLTSQNVGFAAGVEYTLFTWG